MKRTEKKTAGRGRRAPKLWRPELDAAMPQSWELRDLADRLLHDPKEARAVLAALSLIRPADGADPVAGAAEAGRAGEDLRALIDGGSVMASLLAGVMHRQGGSLARDDEAAERLLGRAREAGIMPEMLVCGNAAQGGAGAADGAADGAQPCGAEPMAAFCALRLGRLFEFCALELTPAEGRLLTDWLLERARRGSWEALEEARTILASPASFTLYDDEAGPWTDGARGADEAENAEDAEEEEGEWWAGPPEGSRGELALLDAMARDGCAEAMEALGLVWLYGVPGRKPDSAKGRQWLRRAWETGDADAGVHLARIGLEKWLQDEETRRPAPARPMALLREAVERGSSWACDVLGQALYKGARKREQLEEALHWFGRAADSGMAGQNLETALKMIAINRERPWEVSPLARREDGLALLRRGAAADSMPFLTGLAPYRMCGLDGEAADPAAGLATLERGVAEDFFPAMSLMAEICVLGLHGVPQQPERGFELADRCQLCDWSPRCDALLHLAGLGVFGERAAELQPLNTNVLKDRFRDLDADPLYRIYERLFRDRASEIQYGKTREEREKEEAERPPAIRALMHNMEVETRFGEGGELLAIWIDALRQADMGALHFFARCLEKMPDTQELKLMAGGFAFRLGLPEPMTPDDLRRLAARSVIDPAWAWKEYVLPRDCENQEDEQ